MVSVAATRGRKPAKAVRYDLYQYDLAGNVTYVGAFTKIELADCFNIPGKGNNLVEDVRANKAKYQNGTYRVRPSGTEAKRQKELQKRHKLAFEVPPVKCSSGCRFRY